MTPTKALITLRETHWSGANGGREITNSIEVSVEAKTRLTPLTLGADPARYTESSPFWYELIIDSITPNAVTVARHNLVIRNPEGTINLTAPRSGKLTLRLNETAHLSTALMDAGTSVTLTVDQLC